MTVKISVITIDNLKREEIDLSGFLKLEFIIDGQVFSIRQREGELCVSVDGQIGIKPIGSNLITLSAN